MWRNKKCFVPMCTNTIVTAPDKFFVMVPEDPKKRDRWMKAAHRSETKLSRTRLWCCEDHFNLEEDVLNLMEANMMGSKKRLKPDVVPSKFDCQNTKLVCTDTPICSKILPEISVYDDQLCTALQPSISPPQNTQSSTPPLMKPGIVSFEFDSVKQKRVCRKTLVCSKKIVWESRVDDDDELCSALQSSISPQSSTHQFIQPQLPIKKVDNTETSIENGDSLRNMMKRCTNTTGRNLTQLTGIISGEFHDNKSIRPLGSNMEHKLHGCASGGKNFIIIKSVNNLKSNLNKHIITDTGDSPHICNFCAKSFSCISKLERHIVTHTGDKPYICSFCGKSFSQKHNLKKHIVTHTGDMDSSHICNFCDKSFSYNSQLKRHILTHTGDKPYICSFCGKSFNQKPNLNMHIVTHTGDRPYTCNFCDKTFAQKSHLEFHIVTHIGDKSHICIFCCKTFTRKSHLRSHIVTHTGDRPHVCNFCGKTFAQKSHLKGHIRTHTGDKPHICNICAKSFSDVSNLTRHLATHKGDIPYTCTFCNERFSQESNLNKHMVIHTGNKPHVCNYCDQSFAFKSDLNTHIISHTGDRPHICNFCGKSFSYKSLLNRHIVFCRKSFNLNKIKS